MDMYAYVCICMSMYASARMYLRMNLGMYMRICVYILYNIYIYNLDGRPARTTQIDGDKYFDPAILKFCNR